MYGHLRLIPRSANSTTNYPDIENLYSDVNSRLLLPQPLSIYVAGPPCQGFSQAGQQLMWDDPRSRLYMQAIWVTEFLRPRIALIENSPKVAKALNSLLLAKVTYILQSAGYMVHHYYTNTSLHSLPQNRDRLYLVAIHTKYQVAPFVPPGPLSMMDLSDFLIPKHQDDNPRDRMPTAAQAAKAVDAAFLRANTTEHPEWVIASHLSERFQKNPKPHVVCPALTAGLGHGHWLGSRGRPLTLNECSRLQGCDPTKLQWHHMSYVNFHMLGNTMSVPVLHRLIISCLHALGYAFPDPWADFSAQHQLIRQAATERFSTTSNLQKAPQYKPTTGGPRKPKATIATKAQSHTLRAFLNMPPARPKTGPALPNITISGKTWAKMQPPGLPKTAKVPKFVQTKLFSPVPKVTLPQAPKDPRPKKAPSNTFLSKHFSSRAQAQRAPLSAGNSRGIPDHFLPPPPPAKRRRTHATPSPDRLPLPKPNPQKRRLGIHITRPVLIIGTCTTGTPSPSPSGRPPDGEGPSAAKVPRSDSSAAP